MEPNAAPGMVIFDLDDTLLRTARAVTAARQAVLARAFPTWTTDRLRLGLAIWRASAPLYRDQLFADTMRLIAVLTASRIEPGINLDALCAEYHADQVRLVRPNATVVRAATMLRDDGYLLAMVSNGDPGVQHDKLVRCGIAELVPPERTVICDGRTIPYKPDPAGLRTVMRASLPTVLVGDRVTDVICARLAGIPVVRLRGACADVERGAALAPAARPDRHVTAPRVYAAARSLLAGTG